MSLRDAKIARLRAWEAVCLAVRAYGEACAKVALLEGGPVTPRVLGQASSSTSIRAIQAHTPMPSPAFLPATVQEIPRIGNRVERLDALPSGTGEVNERGLVVGVYGVDAEVEWDIGKIERWPLLHLRVVA